MEGKNCLLASHVFFSVFPRRQTPGQILNNSMGNIGLYQNQENIKFLFAEPRKHLVEFCKAGERLANFLFDLQISDQKTLG